MTRTGNTGRCALRAARWAHVGDVRETLRALP